MSSDARIFVPELDALVEGEARVFRFRRESRALEGFVLRAQGELVAYANVCPHWSVDLDLGVGRFWDPIFERILCINHGARFHPQTGICDWGPCRGDVLERFELEREGSGGWVTVPAAEAETG